MASKFESVICHELIEVAVKLLDCSVISRKNPSERYKSERTWIHCL